MTHKNQKQSDLEVFLDFKIYLIYTGYSHRMKKHPWS